MTLASDLVKGHLTTPVNLPISSSPTTIMMSGATTGSAPEVDDFIFFYCNASGTSTTANTPAPPTGFTELVGWQPMGTSGSTMWALYVKRRAVGETDYSFPQVNINRTATVEVSTFWIDGTGSADVTSWIIGALKTRAASGGTFSTEALSVNTTAVDSTAWGFGVERTSATETEANLTVSGTGWTKRLAKLGAIGSSGTITVASKPMASIGATGAVTFTSTNTQAANGHALQIVIPASAGVTPPPTSAAGKIYNGTSVVSGHWYLKASGSGVDTVDYAGMIHPGSSSITEMLAKPVFYVAHRGGSANYPEHSMQGYTQSALRGYDALEASLARSADGVWFGLHDASLDRTSLGTGGGSGTTYVASTMTWAQILTHDSRPATVAPVNSLHQPYMKLDDLLDKYLDSHVIFIDPKAAGGVFENRTELISILKNRPNWQEKIVAKSVPGNSSNPWQSQARAAGFVTNAMFYPADNFLTYHTQGDILGMDYGADAPTWASIVGLGKPVMVHVCPTLASVTAGTSKGAKGAMVSGVVQVPRAPMS